MLSKGASPMPGPLLALLLVAGVIVVQATTRQLLADSSRPYRDPHCQPHRSHHPQESLLRVRALPDAQG